MRVLSHVALCVSPFCCVSGAAARSSAHYLCVVLVLVFQVIDSPKHIFLIMEFAPGGELFDYIVKKGRVKGGLSILLMRIGMHFLMSFRMPFCLEMQSARRPVSST